MSSKFIGQDDVTVLVIGDEDRLWKEKKFVIDDENDTNKKQRKRSDLTMKYPKWSRVINERYRLLREIFHSDLDGRCASPQASPW